MNTINGIWANSASWDLELALKRIEIDYVTADCQHGTWSLRELERLFSQLGARALGRCRPLVRTNIDPSAAEVGHYLDAGAWGVVVPYVSDAAQLRAIRRTMHYAPHGMRSLARNIGLYNTDLRTLDEYVAWSKDHLTLMAIVESRSALDRVDEIAEASDGILFGLNDLALDLGTDLDACLALIAGTLERSGGIGSFGCLGIDVPRQRALGCDIINLGNVKDFIGETVHRKLRELAVDDC